MEKYLKIITLSTCYSFIFVPMQIYMCMLSHLILDLFGLVVEKDCVPNPKYNILTALNCGIF